MSDATLARQDALVQSLRQCATHPGGPLRAVADLAMHVDELGLDGVDDLAAQVMCYLDTLPDDRRVIATSFFACVWRGLQTLALEAATSS